MKLKRFKTYQDYLKLQEATLKKRGIGPYFTWMEIEKIAQWMKRRWTGDRRVKGVCHGARNGLECDEFKKHFPGADVFGTDLHPYSGRSNKVRGSSLVVKHDFSVQRPEWVGAFDFVYSNSLAHAADPEACLRTWMEQLVPDGFLALQWESHQVGRVGGGDIFGASVMELSEMVHRVGKIQDNFFVDCPPTGKLLARKALKVWVVMGSKG